MTVWTESDAFVPSIFFFPDRDDVVGLEQNWAIGDVAALFATSVRPLQDTHSQVDTDVAGSQELDVSLGFRFLEQACEILLYQLFQWICC